MADRRAIVATRAARVASQLTPRATGLWFDDDVRRNLYLAVHTVAACTDLGDTAEAGPELLSVELHAQACTMIERVLALQVDDPADPMYGHWPMLTSTDSDRVVANHQPGELMVCVLVAFRRRYRETLPASTLVAIDRAISHQYNSAFARSPLYEMHHHDATHVAQCLLLGSGTGDEALLQQGIDGTRKLLSHIRTFGFKEYGALPWFWHWIQAFDFAWQELPSGRARDLAEEMLQTLWAIRVDSYLGGAWVGARSRQWPHDIPTDTNVALDYIQFGDFPLPQEMDRWEGAALCNYQAPEQIRLRATDRAGAREIKKQVSFATAERRVEGAVNLYTYITPSHAVGGVWERKRQFDNEQHRWDVAFPLTEGNVDRSVNHAYLFHPGDRFREGDLRHQSTYGDVLYHQDSVIQLWNVPQDDVLAHPDVIGCLPLGEWIFQERHAYGLVEGVYLSLHTMHPFSTETHEDRVTVRAPLRDGTQGVIMECTGPAEALQEGVTNLEQYRHFHEAANHNMYRSMIVKAMPYFSTGRGVGHRGVNPAGDAVRKQIASYTTFGGTHLLLEVDALGRCERFVDGSLLPTCSYPSGP